MLRCRPRSSVAVGFKPHQRGGGCCSGLGWTKAKELIGMFQTPSAGRWVLQPTHKWYNNRMQTEFQTPSAGRWVLQPFSALTSGRPTTSFKPHQRGGGCCSAPTSALTGRAPKFQTPSAGRWVLQLETFLNELGVAFGGFKPHQRGGGCCSLLLMQRRHSNNSSFKPHQRGGGCCSPAPAAEVEVAAVTFQTPSAGRWVLQLRLCACCVFRYPLVSNPISGEVGAAATVGVRQRAQTESCFKPHQRGGGCCSRGPGAQAWSPLRKVSNPISGEVGAAAPLRCWHGLLGQRFQTPSAGRWVLQRPSTATSLPSLRKFQTPSAGRWVLQPAILGQLNAFWAWSFQTPSAGRWVLQRTVG